MLLAAASFLIVVGPSIQLLTKLSFIICLLIFHFTELQSETPHLLRGTSSFK